jgi:hypothetical protein
MPTSVAANLCYRMLSDPTVWHACLVGASRTAIVATTIRACLVEVILLPRPGHTRAREMKSKLTKEIPRLCRGGSKRLTFPAVAPQAPIDEASSASRQAHKQSSMSAWESLSDRVESAKCYAALFPRIAAKRIRSCNTQQTGRGTHEPPSGGPHIGGAPATPIAALSGSTRKAPGFAGGCLLECHERVL